MMFVITNDRINTLYMHDYFLLFLVFLLRYGACDGARISGPGAFCCEPDEASSNGACAEAYLGVGSGECQTDICCGAFSCNRSVLFGTYNGQIGTLRSVSCDGEDSCELVKTYYQRGDLVCNGRNACKGIEAWFQNEERKYAWTCSGDSACDSGFLWGLGVAWPLAIFRKLLYLGVKEFYGDEWIE